MKSWTISLFGAAVSVTLAIWATDSAMAFKHYVHTPITRAAFSGLIVGQQTITTIAKENVDTDDGAVTGGPFHDKRNHFDDEVLSAGAALMAKRLNDAITKLDQCDKAEAMKLFGMALHALQDFYSHSNWVENMITSPSVTPANVQFFPDLVVVDSAGSFASGPLSENDGFVQATGLVCEPNPGPPFGYDLTKVSTGYFPGVTVTKCSHGELNKDDPGSDRGSFVINSFSLHEFARKAAERHTRLLTEQFIQAIVDRFPGERGGDLVNFFIHDNRNVAYCIDSTKSMRIELQSIKPAITAQVSAMIAAGEAPVLHLFTFSDSVSFVGRTCAPATFQGWVNGIAGTGGADCPEASLTAARDAIEKVGEGGKVIIATDASPREGAGMQSQVENLAKDKKVALSYLLTGNCDGPGQSAGDPESDNEEEIPPGWPLAGGLTAADTYGRLAAATGRHQIAGFRLRGYNQPSWHVRECGKSNL